MYYTERQVIYKYKMIKYIFNIVFTVHRDKIYNRTNEMQIFILF
jgi:hypothetical protein